jgi:PhzF family phenazine biosynthesis protein
MTSAERRPIRFVDVFGREALSGNPLAVVGDSEGLDEEAMLALARWLNLSETTFLAPPSDPRADYKVRIFTPARELPFAGHPTLGSARAWLAAGGLPRVEGRIVQECGAGLVPIREDGERLAFAAPPLIRSGPPTPAELAEACEFLGVARDAVVDAAWVDNGPGWLGVMLASAEAVLALQPAASWPRHVDIGVVGPQGPGGETAFEVRALFSDHTGAVREDPVTGSLNASLAQWLFASGRADGAYVAAQGTRLGRKGRVFVSRDEAGGVWIGGAARILIDGFVEW